jgi:hypothetical protein
MPVGRGGRSERRIEVRGSPLLSALRTLTEREVIDLMVDIAILRVLW